MVSNDPLEKDVQDALLNARSFRRRRSDVPYPIQHIEETSIFDIWDSMFVRFHSGNLTMCQIDKSPAVVLDLGCGTGYWAIEAARRWKTSMVVGFDIYDRQPKLALFHEQYRDVVHRIRWVHGNLLDGLPFPPAHFDFVRIANIGLGVPEDEWQSVFEEVFRVMLPGAVIEVIEEDPIFPCARCTSLSPHVPELPPIAVDISLDSPPPSATSHKNFINLSGSDVSCGAFDDQKSETSSAPSSNTSLPMTSSEISPTNIPSNTPSFHQLPNIQTPNFDSVSDLLDHSKLKTAWDAMLSSRFIAKNLSAVLPLYFSSLFADVQIHQPLKIPLPLNSGRLEVTRPREASFGETLTPQTYANVLNPSSNTIMGDSSQLNLHLAKTVNTVKGCKAAVWEEYKKLYGTGFTPIVARTSAGARSGSEASVRDMFDEQWAAWENDMLDRIGMRSLIQSELGWAEPPGDKPGFQSWRSLVDSKFPDNSVVSSSSSCPTQLGSKQDQDICRSIRAYVGWKL